jgi:hypothetical protein
MLTPQHVAFFRTFGYLHIPGYFAEEIAWIVSEFDAVWASRPDLVHDGSKRSIFPTLFVGATPRLSTLIEHPKVAAVCEALLGSGYGIDGGDGNLYSGDTDWHSDDCGEIVSHLKIAFYLDPLTRDDGALRVIPGSHLMGDRYAALLEQELPTWGSKRVMLLPGAEVPAVALESRPGDLVCFDHRIKHASFGGSGRRRMFAMNWTEAARTPEQREVMLTKYRHIRDHHRIDWRFSDDWFRRAPAAREPMLAQLREFGELVMSEVEGAAGR